MRSRNSEVAALQSAEKLWGPFTTGKGTSSTRAVTATESMAASSRWGTAAPRKHFFSKPFSRALIRSRSRRNRSYPPGPRPKCCVAQKTYNSEYGAQGLLDFLRRARARRRCSSAALVGASRQHSHLLRLLVDRLSQWLVRIISSSCRFAFSGTAIIIALPQFQSHGGTHENPVILCAEFCPVADPGWHGSNRANTGAYNALA